MQNSKIKKDNFNLKFLLALLIVGIVFMAVKYCQNNINIPEALKLVEEAGVWAPVLYIVIYILISGIIIPSIVIKIFAGTLFGVVWGLVFVSIAATISSLIKFLLARYLFRGRILKKVEKSEYLKALDQAIEKDGWKMLMILRNIPVINSMLLNYICGLTKMKVRSFVVASFIGRLPTTIMYIYLGYILRYTYTVSLKTDTGKHATVEKIVLFIGLAATAGAVFYLIHLSKKIIAKKVPTITVPPLDNKEK